MAGGSIAFVEALVVRTTIFILNLDESWIDWMVLAMDGLFENIWQNLMKNYFDMSQQLVSGQTSQKKIMAFATTTSMTPFQS